MNNTDHETPESISAPSFQIQEGGDQRAPGNAPVPEHTAKPGYRTTEFWLTIAIALAALAEHLTGILPAEYALGIAAFSGAIYKICRAFTKSAERGGDDQ